LQSLNDEPINISTQTTANISNGGLSEGVYDTNESYINSLPRPSVSSDISTPTVILPNTYVQGGVVPGNTENSVTNFGALAPGDSIQVGGLKLTASSYMSPNEVAIAFQNITEGGSGLTSKGNFTGTLIGWASSSANGNSVTFTSSTIKSNVTDLNITNSINSYGQISSAVIDPSNGYGLSPTPATPPTPGTPEIPAQPGLTQRDILVFNDMKKGDSFNLAGITVNVTSQLGISGAELASLFANNAALLSSSNKINNLEKKMSIWSCFFFH
jgi:hypothetical protein